MTCIIPPADIFNLEEVQNGSGIRIDRRGSDRSTVRAEEKDEEKGQAQAYVEGLAKAVYEARSETQGRFRAGATEGMARDVGAYTCGAAQKAGCEVLEGEGRAAVDTERLCGVGNRGQRITTDDVLAGRSRWIVIAGDCLDVMRGLPDRSVAHVITDPPYEAEAHNLQRRVGGRAWKRRGGQAVQAPIDFLPISEDERSGSGSEIARIVQRWALVFCQSEAAMLWRWALEPLGYRRTCIWVKPDGMPQLTGDRPGMGYESFVCAHVKGRSRWNGGGRHGVFVHCKDKGGGAGIRNEHPTTKPTSLMLELVSLFSDPDDVILDPFAGSGTTGVAALRLGRRAILIERDPKYAALAIERMLADESQHGLQSHRAGQLTLLDGV